MTHRSPRDRAMRSIAAVGGAFALLVGLATAGWVLLRPDTSAGRSAAAAQSPSTSSTSLLSPTIPGRPTATVTASGRPKPTVTKKPTPRPTPSHKPAPGQLPPPPPKPTTTASTGSNCPRHAGTDAPRDTVKAALLTAAAHQYWQGTSPPVDLIGPMPTITVPADLMKAVAWQESGWQSTIIACDGGVGTMQVMSGTAPWMNNRFGTSYDINTLAGNTSLGAEYLEWLTLYFGLYYFGSYDLTATAPVGAGGATMVLRDVVISAYNVGPGALEHNNGTPTNFTDDWLSIPNPGYVDSVTALVTSCVCLAY